MLLIQFKFAFTCSNTHSAAVVQDKLSLHKHSKDAWRAQVLINHSSINLLINWLKPKHVWYSFFSNYYFEILQEPLIFIARNSLLCVVVVVWHNMCLENAFGVKCSCFLHHQVKDVSACSYCSWHFCVNKLFLAHDEQHQTFCWVTLMKCMQFVSFFLSTMLDHVNEHAFREQRGCLAFAMIHWRSFQIHITFSKQTLANKIGILDSCVYRCNFLMSAVHLLLTLDVAIWIICSNSAADWYWLPNKIRCKRLND